MVGLQLYRYCMKCVCVGGGGGGGGGGNTNSSYSTVQVTVWSVTRREKE